MSVAGDEHAIFAFRKESQAPTFLDNTRTHVPSMSEMRTRQNRVSYPNEVKDRVHEYDCMAERVYDIDDAYNERVAFSARQITSVHCQVWRTSPSLLQFDRLVPLSSFFLAAYDAGWRVPAREADNPHHFTRDERGSC